MSENIENNNAQNELDFQLEFTDDLMKQSEGHYFNVKALAQHQDEVAKNTWNVHSGLYLQSQFGQAYFELEFYHDKSVIITKFIPSPTEDIRYNMDIRCLSQFCIVNEWNVPQPVQYLIEDNYEMWKQFWQTNIIKSRYFQKKIKRS